MSCIAGFSLEKTRDFFFSAAQAGDHFFFVFPLFATLLFFPFCVTLAPATNFLFPSRSKHPLFSPSFPSLLNNGLG